MTANSKRTMALALTALLALGLNTIQSAHAQTFTTLHTFDGTDGRYPYAGLMQASGGDLYGTTYGGGINGFGTVFRITPSGKLKTLHNFDDTDGAFPYAGLFQAIDGNFYGTTDAGGGIYGFGTVFKITNSGTLLTTLYSFCPLDNCTDGASPYSGGLIQGSGARLLGTTRYGGTNGAGAVFEITRNGTPTLLYSFCSQTGCTDGEGPYAGLVRATGGDFYGTTSKGGAYGYGTVFRITPSGTLTTLHSFDNTDGANPYAGLIQAGGGDLFGTTQNGGAYGYGTVFKITPSGTLTTLHSFDLSDGEYPWGGLIQATDGNLYGTTWGAGAYGFGTVFRITPSGKLKTLHNFDITDGANPFGTLLQATDGNLYGTTGSGSNTDGTIFRLSVGLGPFVALQTTSGPVGAAVKILGTDLTGASSVTFNGTEAVFTVASASEIKATVPTGATKGLVQVVTPSGTLTSNVVYTVED